MLFDHALFVCLHHIVQSKGAHGRGWIWYVAILTHLEKDAYLYFTEESLTQVARLQNQLPTFETEMVLALLVRKMTNIWQQIQTINTQLYVPLMAFITDDTEARKPLQKKYDKARSEYDSISAKAKQIGSNKKVDVVKFYNAEKEKDKAKKIMDTCRAEYAEYLEELQARISYDILELFIQMYESYKAGFAAAYNELSEIKEYIDSLANWCVQETSYFKDMVTRRETDWVIAKQYVLVVFSISAGICESLCL